ncbi:hypothetical protein DF186_22340, partial [Enterococcus hirae]
LCQMKDSLRQFMGWYYIWCGLLFGWVLFGILLIGLLVVFYIEINFWTMFELCFLVVIDWG